MDEKDDAGKLVKRETGSNLGLIKRTKGDIVHSSIRVLLSSIPGAGPILAEIFSLSVESPLGKRRDEMLIWLANKVNDLEKQGLFKKEYLKNDEFLDIITHALQIAIRNSKKEKIQALQNAIVNSLLGIDIEQDLRFVFLNFIDILSPTHVKILTLFADPAGGMQKENKDEFPDYRYNTTVDSIQVIFSDFKDRADYYGLIIDDLKSKGLLHVGYHGDEGLEGDFTDRATIMGKQFIKFITLQQLV